MLRNIALRNTFECRNNLGGICSVINTNRYGLREAFEMGLIERDVIPDLELGYNAILGFPSKNGAMTIMEACRLEKISEQDAVRMLHVQVCSLPVDFCQLSVLF